MLPDISKESSLPIGVATLHYGFNEGAILQAMALTKAIEGHFDSHRVEVIDQRYPLKIDVYGEASDPRKAALLRAIDQWLPLSKKKLRERSARIIFRHIRDSYAAIVVGSDVVWNLHYRRCLRRFVKKGLFSVQDNPFFPPFPNFYWPGNEVACPKIAYAASVGTLNFDDVPFSHRKQMASRLATFNLLGVRDEKTWDFVTRLSPSLVSRLRRVPDPTILYDVLDKADDDSLRSKLEKAGVDFSRRRIGVIMPDSREMTLLAEQLRAQGCQVVGITTRNSFSDVNLFECDLHPLEWGRVFSMVDVCIINRMHGMIFALQNHVPFIAVDQYKTEHGLESKVYSLLQSFGLVDCLVDLEEKSIQELLEKLNNYATLGWDWERIDSVRRSLRQGGMDFLKEMMTFIN